MVQMFSCDTGAGTGKRTANGTNLGHAHACIVGLGPVDGGVVELAHLPALRVLDRHAPTRAEVQARIQAADPVCVVLVLLARTAAAWGAVCRRVCHSSHPNDVRPADTWMHALQSTQRGNVTNQWGKPPPFACLAISTTLAFWLLITATQPSPLAVALRSRTHKA